MNNKTKLGLVIISILVFVGVIFYLNSGYESRTMVVTDWNYIQLGYNIFGNNDNTLFLHGGDWRLTEFLESQEYPKRMTFRYHKETTGCETNVGCRTWNHILDIRDEYGTKIFESELWQEW